MLTQTQIEEIRNYLKNSKNPLFFFDGDADGLCSYLILKKYTNKGKGAVIKKLHMLSLDFYHKVEEYSPDVIFVLDIANVDQEFINRCNSPIVWIDHHQLQEIEGVHYYNPRANGEAVPTSYMAYKIAEEKELFLGTLGSISDWYFPEYAKDFSDKYPNLLPKNITDPPEIIFDSKLGEVIMLFNLLLKNATSKIHRMANLLLRVEDPNELLELKTPKSKFIHNETKANIKEYQALIKKLDLKKPDKDKLFVVELPKTKNPYTSIVSNYLIYKNPKKIIIISRRSSEDVIMSLRSASIPINEILKESLEGLDGFGGGHELACGASVKEDQYEKFLERFRSKLKK